MRGTHDKKIASEVRAAIFLFSFLLSAALPVCGQEPLQMPPEETPATQQKRLYADAKPYLLDALPDLPKAVPELRGFDSAATQQDLPGLLASVGKEIQGLLAQMPNLVCREEVKQSVVPGMPSLDGRPRQFNYLILLEGTPSGVTMREYRTDSKNRRIGEIGQDPQAPLARGFALAWMYFHPSRLSESEFRYLGAQKVDGRKTLVVAFAQEPGRVNFPGAFENQGRSFVLLFQGIAWIDASSFRIIRLRTDLLAPQAAAQLLKLTTEVDFTEVRVPHVASRLWLPRKAAVEWQSGGFTGTAPFAISHGSAVTYRGVEEHAYSNYHVYEVAVQINPASSER